MLIINVAMNVTLSPSNKLGILNVPSPLLVTAVPKASKLLNVIPAGKRSVTTMFIAGRPPSFVTVIS